MKELKNHQAHFHKIYFQEHLLKFLNMFQFWLKVNKTVHTLKIIKDNTLNSFTPHMLQAMTYP